jgi:large subunit ribosomal protein L35
MPKMKTHSGAKKRFRVTAGGKVKFKHANLRHMLVNRDPKVKRKHRKGGILSERDERHILRLLCKIT